MTQVGSGLEDCIYPIPVNKKRKKQKGLIFFLFYSLSKTQISIIDFFFSAACYIFYSDAEVS